MIRGKTVFIGAARDSWFGQKDGFYTVFSRPDGLDISGVELGATIFSNLLEDCRIVPLSLFTSIFLFVCCSCGLSLICFGLSPKISLLTLVLYGAAYLYISFTLFINSFIWTPVVMPAVLVPLILFLISVIYKHTLAFKEKNRVRKALGLYLPANVVDELSRDLSYIKTGDRVLYATCLMTDAQNYTTLSERLEPEQLSELMKSYYHCLFTVVEQYGGLVCNMIGDSMLALWPTSGSDPEQREKACRAAVDMIEAVSDFNNQHPDKSLPTRVGLHAGNLLMGNIGAKDHFEYAPVGDVVNTNSRIESLNKNLGTKILASEETVQGLGSVQKTKVGTFLLGGKTKPIVIYEIHDDSVEDSAKHQTVSGLFDEGLVYFCDGRFEKASKVFIRCFELSGNSYGPAKFYIEQCSILAVNPPDGNWQGVIAISK